MFLTNMNRRRRRSYSLLSLFGGLAAPLACVFAFVGGLNAANNYFGVAVNGQCEAGTSCPGVAVPYDTSHTLPATIRVTLPNGDKYLVNGQSSGSNNANGTYPSFGPLFQVRYEGNATGGVSAADTIVVDWYASFQTTIGSGKFGFNLYGGFSVGIARSSSVTGCLNGNCQGPAAPPGSFNNGAESYTLDSSGGAFAFDNTYTFNFGAGSHVGSYIVINQTTALNPPAIASFSPPSGPAGASVTITGTNLTGATAVRFHHAAASYTVNSATQITATVPSGATTGTIQVATTGGLATSKTAFTVTAGSAQIVSYSNSASCWSYLPNGPCTMTLAVTAGQFLVCASSVDYLAYPAALTMSDGGVNTYNPMSGSPYFGAHTIYYGAIVYAWTATAATTGTLSLTAGQTGGTLWYVTSLCAAYSGSSQTPIIDQLTVNTSNTDAEPTYWTTGYTETTTTPTEMLVAIFGENPNETTLTGGGEFWSAGNVLLGSGNIRQMQATGEAVGSATILQDYSVDVIGSYQSTWPPLDAFGAAIIFTLR